MVRQNSQGLVEFALIVGDIATFWRDCIMHFLAPYANFNHHNKMPNPNPYLNLTVT